MEIPAIADSLSFHVVTAGSCVVTLVEGDPVSSRAADLALVPHDRGHVLASEPGLAPSGRVDLVPQHWTLATLAREAGMSRSSFATRFAELVGEPPMAYVTRWRMQVARTRLEAGAMLSQVAASLGYRSDAAFTRGDGITPGAVRRGRRPS